MIKMANPDCFDAASFVLLSLEFLRHNILKKLASCCEKNPLALFVINKTNLSTN